MTARGLSAGRALVTGASRGIGKAVTEALAMEGWSITGTCRDPRRLAVTDRLPGVRYLPLDLGSAKSIESVIQTAGDVDLLVNNAGESPIGPAEEIPINRMKKHFQINFFGPAALMQGFLPGMRARHRGMIIFIGSIRSEAPTPFSSIYAASKAAIRSFGECLRLELLGTGVSVSVVAPWYVRTGIPQELFTPKESPYSAALQGVRKVRDRKIATAPDPETVGKAVLRLVRARHPAPFIIVGKPFQTFIVRHTPRGLLSRMSARVTGMRPFANEKSR